MIIPKRFEWNYWLNIEIKNGKFIIKYDTAIMYERTEELEREMKTTGLLNREAVLELLVIKFINNNNDKASPSKYYLRKLIVDDFKK